MQLPTCGVRRHECVTCTDTACADRVSVQITNGVSRKRVGFTVGGAPARGAWACFNGCEPTVHTLVWVAFTRRLCVPGVCRASEGAKVFAADGETEIGVVTSGTRSPVYVRACLHASPFAQRASTDNGVTPRSRRACVCACVDAAWRVCAG